jgi:hypothetical protein
VHEGKVESLVGKDLKDCLQQAETVASLQVLPMVWLLSRYLAHVMEIS